MNSIITDADAHIPKEFFSIPQGVDPNTVYPEERRMPIRLALGVGSILTHRLLTLSSDSHVK